MNPKRGAPNYAESSRLILSVILGVHSHHDSVGENPIFTWPTHLERLPFLHPVLGSRGFQ